MIAVVTGASGFIGSNLVEALVADGIEVRLIRRPGPRYHEAPRGTTAVTLDLSSADAADHAVWRGATHVFHLAGRTRALDRESFMRDNVAPTARLSEIAARRATPPRFVFVSSQAAAGPAPSADRPVCEDDTAAPVEGYGASKLAAERAVQAHAGALPSVILRPASVFGPHDRDFLQVFQQMRGPLALEAVPSWFCLSLVAVHDVVAALRLAASHDAAVGRTFFVDDGAPATWGAVYDEVGAIMGRSPMRLRVPALVVRAVANAAELAARLRRTEPLLTRAKLELARHPYWLCDASALRRTLGWQPSLPRSEAWALTYQWYREARWIRS